MLPSNSESALPSYVHAATVGKSKRGHRTRFCLNLSSDTRLGDLRIMIYTHLDIPPTNQRVGTALLVGEVDALIWLLYYLLLSTCDNQSHNIYVSELCRTSDGHLHAIKFEKGV